jgi:hypothetical protein
MCQNNLNQVSASRHTLVTSHSSPAMTYVHTRCSKPMLMEGSSIRGGGGSKFHKLITERVISTTIDHELSKYIIPSRYERKTRDLEYIPVVQLI